MSWGWREPSLKGWLSLSLLPTVFLSHPQYLYLGLGPPLDRKTTLNVSRTNRTIGISHASHTVHRCATGFRAPPCSHQPKEHDAGSKLAVFPQREEKWTGPSLPYPVSLIRTPSLSSFLTMSHHRVHDHSPVLHPFSAYLDCTGVKILSPHATTKPSSTKQVPILTCLCIW